MDSLYARQEMGPQVIWIGKNWGKYGADSEDDRYLGTNEGTRDYDGLQSQTDVEAYVVFAKYNVQRREVNIRDHLNNFRTKWTGAY